MYPPQALGDGRGTAKAFLEEIASQESEAERSLMHRCVVEEIASSFCNIGLAGLHDHNIV